MIKAQLVSITYGNIIKQVYKLSKSSKELNQKLYLIGEQMGLRLADQYNDRQSFRLDPFEKVKCFLKGIMELFFGIQIELINEQKQILKKKFVHNLKYSIKQNHLSDYVLLPQKLFNSVQERDQFNYHSILSGFICGALKTMKFMAEVTVEKDSLKDNNESTKNIEGSSMKSGILQRGKNQLILQVNMEKQKKNDD